MKKRTSRVWKILGVLLLVPVLLLALLQTPQGKILLASALSRSLSASDNLHVRIGKISGWVPAAVRIDQLEIGDAEGVWLTADGLHCRWMVGELMQRRIRVAQLGAESIELHRFPAAAKTDRPSVAKPHEFRPVEVVLDELMIGQLKLDEGVAGMPLEYAVHSGGIRLLSSGRLTGKLNVEGDAVGRVELNAFLGDQQEHRLEMLAELDRLVNSSLGLDRFSGRAEAALTREGVRGTLSVSVRKDDFEGHLSARLEYARRQLRVPHFGIAAADYSAEGNAQVDFSGEAADVLMDVGFTHAAKHTGSLHAAASVFTENSHWTVDFHPLEIHCLEQICVSLKGGVSRDRLALSGSLEEFDLIHLPVSVFSNFTGAVGGTLSVSGSPEIPEVRVELDVSRFTSSEETLDELPELDFHVSGKLANGSLQGFSAITNAVNGWMTAGFRMPCVFSLEPFLFRPDVGEARADLAADVDLGILNYLSFFNNQRMAGRLNVALAYDRHASGSLRVEQGRYEHFKWGVFVNEMELSLEATDEGLRIDTAAATDGGSGRITMSGGVVSNQLALVLELDGAGIIRRDEVDGMLSGHLEIAGPLARPAVTGLLTVDRMDILIDNIAPALPVLLTDYDALALSNKVDVVKSGSPLPCDLDMQVDLADQVYANASMINSIWGGNLRVQNVPQGISVQGIIEPRRGYVSFIGKKFRFTEGQIDMDGSVPAAPVMNQLTAEYSRGDFTARLILNGRFDNPDFRLESSPPMPEDEILSYVLFNRDTSSITPYQAFQIASAARQLSGGINGPGFMYQMRQAVGVDTLEWREGAVEGEASSVAAGKYLTPALYVEINRSLDQKGETGMMAEYDMTRHFSVETSTGAQMRPGIGINWKNDY